MYSSQNQFIGFYEDFAQNLTNIEKIFDHYRKIYLTNIITLEILDQKCFTFNVTQYFHSHTY